MSDDAPKGSLEKARIAFDNATPYRNQTRARINAYIFSNLHLLAPIAYIVPSYAWRGTFYAFSYDEVQSVLADETVFQLPFHKRMAELDSDGEVSLLGFNDHKDYRRNICQVMRALPLEDLLPLSAAVARQAEHIIDDSMGKVDAIGELLTPIVLTVAQDHFGLKFSDPGAFHRWTMAISNYTFTGENPPESLELAARAAATLTDATLNSAIAAARTTPPPKDTVLGRLIGMKAQDGSAELTDGQVRATIAGLLNGFLPNLPVAGCNVLQVLLRRPAAMRMARNAAQADDDELLQKCVMEALRFQPIDPGRRRLCVARRTANGPQGPSWLGDRRPALQRAYAITLLAMFDGRHVNKPFTFNPARPASDSLAFGFGAHWCVGAPMALCILVQALKPLLRQPGLRRGRGVPSTRHFLGFFPTNLGLEFARARK